MLRLLGGSVSAARATAHRYRLLPLTACTLSRTCRSQRAVRVPAEVVTRDRGSRNLGI
jgi:hypothetical protein